MRIIFLGSAELSIPSLDRVVADGHQVAGVVTQPDRPKGRNLSPSACCVKMHAVDMGLTVLDFDNINAPEACSALSGFGADAFVVAAYGQILRPAVLELPALGCVNVHPSLLPRYRGAAPIQWALINGETRTGVTIMMMNEKMDAGDILRQAEFPITSDDTSGTLHARLAVEGANLLSATLLDIEGGRAVRRPQEHALATFAPRLRKTDGRIDWNLPAMQVYNRIKGMNPWPCCFCEMPAGSSQKVKVLKAEVCDNPAGLPGEMLDAGGDGPLIACGRTGQGEALRLLQVQPEGGKVMDGAAYLRGHAVKVGTRLG